MRLPIISCPTCARRGYDVQKTVEALEERLAHIARPLTLAVMGCVVNGPGEAREADIGVAGGDGCAVLFKKGEILKKVPENEVVSALLSEIEKM